VREKVKSQNAYRRFHSARRGRHRGGVGGSNQTEAGGGTTQRESVTSMARRLA